MRKGLITWFVLGAVAWLGVFFWRRFNALKGLQISVGNPKQIKFENGFLVWIQELVINNPDNVDLIANKANIDLYVNKNYVGKCSLNSPQTIRPNGISVVNVNIVCTTLDLAKALGYTVLELLKLKTIKFDFEGNIGAYGFTAPISISQSINISQIF